MLFYLIGLNIKNLITFLEVQQRLIKVWKLEVLNLSDDSNVVLKTQVPPRSPNRKTLVFGASNVPPSWNTPHTQTCKLPRVEWKPNKILEKKNMKLDARLTTIAIAVEKNFKTTKEMKGRSWSYRKECYHTNAPQWTI